MDEAAEGEVWEIIQVDRYTSCIHKASDFSLHYFLFFYLWLHIILLPDDGTTHQAPDRAEPTAMYTWESKVIL